MKKYLSPKKSTRTGHNKSQSQILSPQAQSYGTSYFSRASALSILISGDGELDPAADKEAETTIAA